MVPSNRVTLRECVEQSISLPPEIEEGNVEYKYKLMPPNDERLEHLCTQLQWRLTEYGECWYELGVSDNGELTGITRQLLSSSLESLKEMCSRVQAEIGRVDKFKLRKQIKEEEDLYVAEVYIRPKQRRKSEAFGAAEEEATEEVRIAFVGESNAGKSTLIAVLTNGQLDNGKGDMRLSLLRHRHEILSGRTSSVALEPLVLSHSASMDELFTPLRLDTFESTDHLALASQRLMLDAPKVLQFFDLPGHPRFHRSALSTFTSLAGPHLTCILVSAVDEAGQASVEEQLLLMRSLEIDAIIVLSKVDLVPPETRNSLCRKLLNFCSLVFPVSTTTGEGIDELLNFLMKQSFKASKVTLAPPDVTCFVVESIKQCEDVGLVLKGTLLQGRMRLAEKQRWLLGPVMTPESKSCFVPVSLKSMHRLRLPIHQVSAGLMAAIAIDGHQFTATRGMLLLNKIDSIESKIRTSFSWNHPNLISGNFIHDKEIQGLLHCGCSRLVVKVRTHESGSVSIETIESSPLVLTEHVKMVLVTSLFVLAGTYNS